MSHVHAILSLWLVVSLMGALLFADLRRLTR
jgi:hypothetical protein